MSEKRRATKQERTTGRRHSVATRSTRRNGCVYLKQCTRTLGVTKGSHVALRVVQEQEEIAKLASKTYRERIEELNQHLGSLTEHHDVPRVRCFACRCFIVWVWV